MKTNNPTLPQRSFFRSMVSRSFLPLAMLLGSINDARAIAYGYSVQQTSGYVFTGATTGSLTPFSSASSAQNAATSGSESTVGALDTSQAYVGPARPPENTFTPLGPVTPDYSRGDALLTLPTFTTANVAESSLAGAGISSGSGAWALSGTLTLTAPGVVTLGLNYTDQLLVSNTAPVGTVAADFGYILSIKDLSGVTVFTSAPNVLNRSLSLTGAGVNPLTSAGSVSITSTTLLAGTYTATLSGDSHVFITVPATSVPDGGTTAALLGLGFVCLGFLSRYRSRANR
jgi:hypothetical protein